MELRLKTHRTRGAGRGLGSAGGSGRWLRGAARGGARWRGVGARAVVKIDASTTLGGITGVLLNGGRGPATEGLEVAEAADVDQCVIVEDASKQR